VNLCSQGIVVSSGEWSEVVPKQGATVVLAPASARKPDEKAKSRTLPLLWVEQSVSVINTNWEWSSQAAKGSAKVFGLSCSEGCQRLWRRLKSPAKNEG
jgi:hypothetical protein